MPELLKDIYHKDFLDQFAHKIRGKYSAFDTEAFVSSVMDESWEGLALRNRMQQIVKRLKVYLPASYEEALAVLFEIDETCVGFPYLFFSDFVVCYGQEERHWDLSMQALERFTQRSSAEFAIRPFLLRHTERGMAQMTRWAQHSNEHVRRLASEGCRPRLPWGEALTVFKEDPMLVFGVLEYLKADESLYVRKSVANNLNDIAKDHPELVIETAKRWKGINPHTDWIVRQGCRTLIRQAHPEVMHLFGYAKTKELVAYAELATEPVALCIGESCELQYKVHLCEGEPVHIRIEYAIDFVKARGKTSRKSFLLSDKTVAGGVCLTGKRNHSWKELTTRRHYPGIHRIVLLVNGREVAEAAVELK
jgi:3-methyladenine DNA glycosylase AlkC